MSLPARLLAGLCTLLLVFGAGWGAHARYRAGVDAREALDISEAAREAERLAARNMTRITDALTSERLAADGRTAALRDRLRQQSTAGTDSASIVACRSDDTATAARVLPAEVGADLVALVDEAEALSARLRACQALGTAMGNSGDVRSRH